MLQHHYEVERIYCRYSRKLEEIKKAPHYCEAFYLVAGTGLEPVTFGL